MPAWDRSQPQDLSTIDEAEDAVRPGRHARLPDLIAVNGTDADRPGRRRREVCEDDQEERKAETLDLDSELEPGLKVREVLRGFEPERLGLPDIPLEAAPGYIEDQVQYRPWLRMAKDQHPLVQRVYAVLDRGQGHLLQRHEGYGGDEAQFERAAYLRDPAQRSELSRLRSVDGFKRRDRQHGCGIHATRVHDPVAFATAVARVQEHPVVRAALQMPYVEGKRPETVESITLEEVLGRYGHLACSGFVLVGDPDQARADRQKWVEAIRNAVPRHSAENVLVLGERARERALQDGLREPLAEPIESFEGGRLRIAFKPNRAKNGYELLTMFASPNARFDQNEERL